MARKNHLRGGGTGRPDGRGQALQQALSRLSRLLISSVSPDLNPALAILGEAAGATHAYVFVFSTDLQRAETVYRWTRPGHREIVSDLEGVPGTRYPWWAARLAAGEDVVVPDPGALPREASSERAAFYERGIRSALAVPLSFGGSTLGFVGFADASGAVSWTPDDVAALRVAAEMISGFLERRRAEEALRQSEEQYRTLVETACDVIFTLSTGGTISSLNPAFEKVTGWSARDWAGKPFPGILHPDDVAAAREQFDITVRGLPSHPFELRVASKGGGYRTGEFYAAPVFRDGKVTNILGIVRDVTERRQAEDALRESRRAFETLLTNLPGIAFRCLRDDKWLIEFASEGALALTGYRPQDFTGNRRLLWADIMHPEDYAAVSADIDRALAAHEPYRAIYRIRTAGGQEKWVWEQGRGVYDSGGECSFVEGFVTDVTDRVHAETALKESEARYRQLVESANSIILRIDTSGRITFFNEYAEKFFGYSREEVFGRPALGTIIPRVDSSGQDLSGLVENAVARPEEYVFHQNENVCRDGRRVWVAWSNRPVFDSRGNFIEMLCVGNDITPLKQAEKALRESEANYRAIFDAANDAIFVHDMETGAVLDVNRRVLEMYGVTAEDVPGTRAGDFSAGAPYTTQDAAKFMAKAARGEPQLFEWVAKHKAGKTFPVEVSLRRASIGGRDRILAVVRDISERKRAEEKLRESEANYRAIFDSVNDAIFVLEIGTARLLDLNRRAVQMFGVDPEEVRSRGGVIPTGTPPYSGDDVLKLVAKAVSGKPQQFEWLARHASGRSFWVEANLRRVSIGGRDRILAVMHDISARKRAEEELLKSANLLSSIIDQSPFSTWISDAEGTAIRQNEACRRLFGIDRDDQIIGKYNLFRDPVLRESPSFHLLEGVFKEGKTASVVLDYDLSRVPGLDIPNAVRRLIQATIFPIKDSSGRVVNAVIQHEDITERRHAENALRDSEERYRRLVDLSPDAIIVHRDGRLLFANPAAVKLFGAESADALVGKFWQGFVHPDDRDEVGRRITSQSDGSWDSVPRQERLLRLDGSVVDVETTAIPSTYEGAPAAQVVLHDITYRKRLEEQLLQSQKMEAIGRLAAGVAHDFNNLLAAILGYSELAISQMGGADPVRADVEEIRKAGQRATALTRHLLAFGRKQMLEPRILDLSAVVGDLKGMLRRLIPENVAIVTSLETSLAAIKADPGQIQQVIINLAVNARDSMPAGGTLAIETANVVIDGFSAAANPAVPQGSYVTLCVSDTGEGMDSETQAHVFEPFFTTKEVGKGIGLGLATVYGVIRQSGGHVTVHSVPGKGSTFRVYLPAVEERAAPAAKPAAEPAGTAGSETILLVEDEPIVRSLVRRVLESKGYCVLEASDGADALSTSAAHQGDIHLVMTDVVMPKVGGRELVSRLVESRPRLKVVYISGYAGSGDVEDAALEGKAAFLQKPFTFDAMAAKVREILDS